MEVNESQMHLYIYKCKMYKFYLNAYFLPQVVFIFFPLRWNVMGFFKLSESS